MLSPKRRKAFEADKKAREEADLRAREAEKAEAARLVELGKNFPGGQVPMHLLPPDLPHKSMQGPMEITHATFDNYKKARTLR